MIFYIYIYIVIYPLNLDKRKEKKNNINTIDQIKSLTATIIYPLNLEKTSKLFSRGQKGSPNECMI